MKVLITGGAGFIGCNWAARLMRGGHEVTVFDNLSRKGTAANLEWLKVQGKLNFVRGDVRDAAAIAEAAKGQNAIYHLAAQVAVTTSVVNPREDFEINALGTFNALEAARAAGTRPVVVYASTNKVYGGMEDVQVTEDATRYRYADLPLGLPETQPLDFHSPYGCSKGAGDQYVRDYARIYGLNTVVFRQSCLAADQEVVTPFGRKPISAL
ncbi:MAG: SDR family NAD(P)-dependent oxidoreductase, partial [Chloroflexota bacterium]